MPVVRPAAVAGLFYPAEPAALHAQIADCVAAARDYAAAGASRPC